MTHQKPIVSLLLAGLLTLSLTACGKDDSPPPAPPSRWRP